VGALLLFVGAGSAVLAGLALVANDPPLVPGMLHRLALSWIVAPAALALVLRRATVATARIEDDMLVFVKTGLRIDVPCGAIAALKPWRLPLPEAGFVVRLRSGRRLAWSVAVDDPSELLSRMAASPAAEAASVAEKAGVVHYASARAAAWRPTPARLLAKLPGFAVPIATPLFVTHQWIAYGGPLGQLHLESGWAWATTAIVYWSTVAIYLFLLASALRVMAECVCFVTALLVPRAALGCRITAEWACRIVYFGGVPLLVLLRYLA